MKNRKFVRITALILAALMFLSVFAGALLSMAR